MVAVPLVAVLALLCAIFFEPFERFFAWAHRYERWQVDELIVVPILLAIAFGLYFWRKEKESERQIAEFTNEAARHKREIAEHKRMEEALRGRETRYRAVVTSLPVALFVVDSDGVFTLAEGEGLDALGLEPDKVVGQSIFESYRDVPQVVENTRRALAGQASKVVTDLGGMTFETRYSPLWEDGKFSGVLGVAFDITERKRAWEALQESERRFSTLLSNTPAMVYRCLNEPDWPEEYVSDYALELTGYPAAEFMENPTLFGSLISEEDKRRIWDEVQEVVGRGERFRLHFAIHHKDGSLRFVEELGQGVYDEEGNVVALEGLIYDVTERERVVERLREAETRYRTLVEGIPAIVYIEEMNGRMTTLYDSPQIENMLGYPQGKHLEDPDYWAKIIHPADRERVLANERGAGARDEPLSQEYRVVAADGRTVWVRDDAVIVRDEAGEPLYWQGFIFDITHRKEAEEALRASEAELRALFEAMTDVILVLDREGRYLKIAPTNPSLLYRPSAEMLGKTVHEVFPKEQADMFLGHIRDALGARETVTFEYGLQIEDRQVWFEATVSPMLEDSVIIVARDISERKRSEEKLREAEERYRTLVE